MNDNNNCIAFFFFLQKYKVSLYSNKYAQKEDDNGQYVQSAHLTRGSTFVDTDIVNNLSFYTGS